MMVVGTFTERHVNELSIPSLLRVLKSGGVLTASVKTLKWCNQSFQEYLDVKERGNLFEVVDVMHGVDYLLGVMILRRRELTAQQHWLDNIRCYSCSLALTPRLGPFLKRFFCLVPSVRIE
jgi:hypothetical protein